MLKEIFNEDLFTNGFKYFLISSFATIILAIIINSIAKLLINRFNKKYKDKIITNQYLYSTIRFLVWMLSVLIIIRQIQPLRTLGTTLLGATSIIAIAVGIAAQATFGNYIAGFFLAVHQPFKVGDIIRIKEKNLSGTVKEINFRHTVLLTQEQTEIIIPNTLMNTAIIEDMSNGIYSELIELKISGNVELEIVEDIINKVVSESKDALNNSVRIVIKNINKDGYVLAFPIYTNSLHEFVEAKNEILPKLYIEFKDNKIDLF